jgi:ATP-dependent DNA ligase
MPRPRSRPRPLSQFIEPCLPRSAAEPPVGPGWLHEIKHDGFRILARRDSRGVRLLTRNGYNFADRFPKIVKAIASLPARSCFIDGEAIVVDENGLSVFDMLRYRHRDNAAVLCAFDLIEHDGADLRRAPIEERKGLLAKLLTDYGRTFVAHAETGVALLDRPGRRQAAAGQFWLSHQSRDHGVTCSVFAKRLSVRSVGISRPPSKRHRCVRFMPARSASAV